VVNKLICKDYFRQKAHSVTFCTLPLLQLIETSS